MADMLRTTGGLLEGQRRSITPDDFQAVIGFLNQSKFSDSLRVALGVPEASRYANAPEPATAAQPRRQDVLDLQESTSLAR